MIDILLNLPRHELLALRCCSNKEILQTHLISVTDFGFASRINPMNPLTRRKCGSEDYAAPEVVMGLDHDPRQSDCWALGVMIYAMCHKQLPFTAPSRRYLKLSHRIVRIDWAWDEERNHVASDIGKNNMLQCREIVSKLLMRVNKRWTIEEVVKHDWLVEGCTPFL